MSALLRGPDIFVIIATIGVFSIIFSVKMPSTLFKGNIVDRHVCFQHDAVFKYHNNLHELSSSPSIISLLHISSSTLLNASPLTRGPLGLTFLGVGDMEAR